MNEYVLWLDSVGMEDVERVGGKNASLGEMIGSLANKGVRVPGGFATTAYAFQQFLENNSLKVNITNALNRLNPNDIQALTETGDQRLALRNGLLHGLGG